MWRDWGKQLMERQPALDAQQLEAFATRMWHGEFVLNVLPETVRGCSTPLLVLPGTDPFHPASIAHEIARLAPDAEVLDPWKDSPERIQQTVEHVRRFLRAHTPAAVG